MGKAMVEPRKTSFDLLTELLSLVKTYGIGNVIAVAILGVFLWQYVAKLDAFVESVNRQTAAIELLTKQNSDQLVLSTKTAASTENMQQNMVQLTQQMQFLTRDISELRSRTIKGTTP